MIIMKPERIDRLRPIWALVLAVALVTSGCQTPPETTATTLEQSVRPGVNAEYLKPELDVTQWIERFEREGREIYELRHEIVKAAKIRPGSDVADIGSGTGLFTELLARTTGPKGKVFAVDIVPKFLKHVEERTARAGLGNVRTVLCTERSIELPAHSIDAAFICDVYHHFEYPASSLASIHRALRPGGELVMIEFKRVPGASSEWILNHVRAGQEVFTAEIEQAGFRLIEEIPILRENYFIRFRKIGR